MRYKKDARVKFTTKMDKVIFGTIVSRTMDGRKTTSIQVKDDQNKLWNLPNAKDLEKL